MDRIPWKVWWVGITVGLYQAALSVACDLDFVPLAGRGVTPINFNFAPRERFLEMVLIEECIAIV